MKGSLKQSGDDQRTKFLPSLFFLLLSGCASIHWEFIKPMNEYRSGHTATRLPDGKVLVAGGFNESGVLNTAELFDPSTKTWASTSSMHVPRFRHTATLLQDGTILVTGGAIRNEHPTPVTDSAEKFDPTTGTWTAVKSMSTKRAFHTATLLQNGSVLVVAGGPTGSLDGQLSAERYIPSSDTWVSSGKSRTAHNRGTATLLPDGTVLVAGGVEFGPEQDNPQIILINYSERYDPNSSSWTELAVMQETPFSHSAALLNDGTALVTGGRSLQTYKYSVRYFPSLRTGKDYPPVWKYTHDLAHPRSNHQSTVLLNGDVLVTGGFVDCIDRTTPPGGCADSLSSVELYHPDSTDSLGGAWKNQENMFNYRGDHTATLLNSGDVLVTGGYWWSAGRALNSAEIFYPMGRPK